MMKDEYHIVPTVKPYLCMLDLLGHAGCIHESYQTTKHRKAIEMQMHAGIWGALLSACRTYSECGDCGGLSKAPSQVGAR
jgi:hypothetical protein